MNFRFDRLPDFVIIGAMKCGTSSLYHYLKLHPKIQMSTLKELDFFVKEKNWNRGSDWYQSHFTESATLRGESSPNYTKYPAFKGIPERMYRLIPEAKLIYIVRDPIQRIVSHYIHNFAARCEHRDLKEALADLDTNHYIHCSRYYMQLEQFLPYYPVSRILIICLDDLVSDCTGTLHRIFRFLEVDSTFTHPEFANVFHQTSQKRRLTNLGVQVTAFPAGGRLRKIIPWLLEQPIKQPVLSESLRQALVDVLRGDVEQLRKLTGCSFAAWSF